MEAFFWVMIFLFGLIFGSFFNVLIFRLNSEEKGVPRFWQGRSFCPKCRKMIAWYDNIPLVSFVLLSGKCRSCKKKISYQYPVVEFLTALITVVVVYFSFPHSPIFQPTLTGFYYLGISYIFLIIFFSDLIYGLIPDELVLIGIVLTGLFQATQVTLRTNLLVGAGAALAFFLIVLITRFRGMGFGDVKLAFLLGFILGFPTAIVGFWVAFVFGGTCAVALVVLKQVRFSATIALGPFLIIGATVAALWSNQLLHLLGL